VYRKCGHKLHSSKKGRVKMCKEIVVKDLQRCHKHMKEYLETFCNGADTGLEEASKKLEQARIIVNSLKGEVYLSSPHSGSERQRKIRVLSKYKHCVRTLEEHVDTLKRSAPHMKQQGCPMSFDERCDVTRMDDCMANIEDGALTDMESEPCICPRDSGGLEDEAFDF